MGWTQPICCDCWDRLHPEAPTDRGHRTHDSGVVEVCCQCGHKTVAGIYIRIDPTTVRYPQSDQSTR